MEGRDVEPGLLRCAGCGVVTERLMAVRESVRALSLGRDLHAGDLVCERCMKQLQEEKTQEEEDRGPA